MKLYLMRTILVIVLIVLFASNVFTSNGYTEPQSSQPSLEETMSFLKGKIENNAGFALRRPRGYPDQIWTYSYRFIRYEKCLLVLGETLSEEKGIVFNDELQIPISELAVSSIKVERVEALDYFAVQGSIFNGQNKIKVLRRFNSPSGNSYSRELQWSDFYIAFTDEALAKRVANALEHAVKLCGGKKEPF